MTEETLISLNYFDNIGGDITEYIFAPNSSAGLASVRLQQKPALIAAQKLGLKVQCLSLSKKHASSIKIGSRPVACLVGKLTAKKENFKEMASANLSFIKFLKNNSTAIIVLYSDNHASKLDHNGMMYRELLNIADVVVTPTNKLSEIVKNMISTHIKIITIEDPWQIPFTSEYPSEIPQNNAKLTWFGTPANAKYLDKELRQFANSSIDFPHINLTILSTAKTIETFRSIAFSKSSPYPLWSYNLTKWDGFKQPQQLQIELSKSQIVLIPSDPNDPEKAGASHNRLVDSARAGCIIIASPLSSYLELEPLAVIGTDFPHMLNKSINNFSYLAKSFAKNRTECLKRFDPVNNLEKWEIALQVSMNISKFST